MTPDKVRVYLSHNTKAIIVVHIFGILANTKSFLEFGLPIIEDFCQAFGAKFGDDNMPIEGDIAVFSFHATKCLTTGEGGAVTSRESALNDKIRNLVKNRVVSSYLTDLQAALGISQLKRYESMLERRRSIANSFLDKLPQQFTQRMKATARFSVFFDFY